MTVTLDSPGEKRCVACGKDVTRGKRMKDSAGKYWCLECGMADQKKKGGVSGESICPECKQAVETVKLVRFQDRYVCKACQSRLAADADARRPTSVGALTDPSKRVRLVAAAVMFLAGVALIVSFLMGII